MYQIDTLATRGIDEMTFHRSNFTVRKRGPSFFAS